MMKSMIMENGVTFKELEKNIYAWICEIGRQFTQEFLERYDRLLMESRDKKKYRNKGRRQITVKIVVIPCLECLSGLWRVFRHDWQRKS